MNHKKLINLKNKSKGIEKTPEIVPKKNGQHKIYTSALGWAINLALAF